MFVEVTVFGKNRLSPHGNANPNLSGQTAGKRGGTAFPFRFWRGNAVPLAYMTAVGGRGKRHSVVR